MGSKQSKTRFTQLSWGLISKAQNFITNGIDWNFGDGTIISGGSADMTHRYQTQGSYTVSAKDSTINHTPISVLVTVLPENRYITVAPPEVRTNETVTVQAFNFRGDYILWDFGDGTQRTGGQTETHAYSRAGEYTITARDENGESQVGIINRVSVKGIDDQVNLEIAEIRLDNGKYYQIVPKNSKNIRAVLRMKMRGTGIVSGFWSIDGHPFEFFNETVSQGMVKEIYTREIPGLPTIEPGIHRITLTLTRPGDLNVRFPELKYFVLPYENILKAAAPVDGFICKDKEIPEFSWEEARGANKYQIAFSDHLYPIMNNTPLLKWIDVGTDLKFTPGEQTWNSIKRNRWTYWKVRALTTNGEVVAESDLMDIKVVIATAKLSILKVTDLEGKEIRIYGSSLRTTAQDLLVRGSVEYMGNSDYLVLRVYAGSELCDQLLFRDVKKGEERFFETSIPHKSNRTRVFFQVLKTSSPAVVVGITNLIFKK
ncbi:MAG: PKD domain-containing protein [bacterium]|nr:PKD domain-containing protein [bacterium]